MISTISHKRIDLSQSMEELIAIWAFALLKLLVQLLIRQK